MKKNFYKCLFVLPLFSSLTIGNTYAKENVKPHKQIDQESNEYEIYPNPQEITYGTKELKLTSNVKVFFEENIDIYTQNKAMDVLSLKNVKASKSTFVNNSDITTLNIGIYGSNKEVDMSLKNKDLSYITNKYDSYYLNISESSITILGKDSDSCFYGLSTLELIFEQTNNTIKELEIKDYSDSMYRGFIEGYYGIPWTSEERKELMRFGSKFKSNIYIYAPKDDSYHSTNWRGLYSENDLKILKSQIEVGRQTKTRFAWAIHPFMSSKITEENYSEGLKAIKAKFNQVYDAGVRQFVVSADDIEATLGEATFASLHTKLLNDLANWAKEKGDCYNLIFVPSSYCYLSNTRLKVDLESYYKYLMQDLDETIQIMWTGNDVCSKVSTGKFQEFTALTNRKPFMWLNWPVNDYAQSRLLMGKGEVLDKSYADEEVEFSGIVTNPMQQAEPSKLSIFAICDYAWNTKKFDMDQSYADSFKYIESKETEAFKEIASHLANTNLYEGEYFEEGTTLRRLINNYKIDLRSGDDITNRVNALIEYYQKLEEYTDNFINNAENRELVEIMKPWVLSIKDAARASCLYLDLMYYETKYTKNQLKQKLDSANAFYNDAFNHKAPVLNAINYNIDYKNVDVGVVVLTPFLNELKYAANDQIKLAIGEPTGIVYSGFKGIYQGDINNIWDDDESTYCWFNDYPSNDAFIRLDYGEVKSIYNVKILFGNANGNTDWMRGTLEYSLDAKTFTKLADINSAEVLVSLNEPIQARFLRLNNKGTTTWVAIKEISINKMSIVTEGLPFINANDSNPSKMMDGDLNTYSWYDWNSPIGSYILIDFAELKKVSKIEFYQGCSDKADDYFRSLTFYYSTDNINYIKIGEDSYESVMDIVINLDKSIDARFIKIVSNNLNKTGVTIREIVVS